MSKFYLVTGGSGFIGSALVRRLVEDGCRVRVLDDNSRGSFGRLADVQGNVELIAGDVRDRAAVDAAVRGVDSVCHCAFVNGTEFFYTKPELVLDIGVKGMVNVLDSAIRHHVPELMLASSSEVYQTPPAVPTSEVVGLSIPDPLNPRYSYAGGKIISELMAINYGRKYFKRVLIFRPHNVYGPAMGWEHVIPQFALRMRDLARGTAADPIRFPIQGTGQETRAFVFIDDLIDGLMIMLERGAHLNIYHIGTQQEVTMAELASRVGEYFGRRVEVLPGKPMAGGTPRRCPDISKLAALGYSPSVSLREGVLKTVKWYDENAGSRVVRAV